jgi:hypothetical protein
LVQPRLAQQVIEQRRLLSERGVVVHLAQQARQFFPRRVVRTTPLERIPGQRGDPPAGEFVRPIAKLLPDPVIIGSSNIAGPPRTPSGRAR